MRAESPPLAAGPEPGPGLQPEPRPGLDPDTGHGPGPRHSALRSMVLHVAAHAVLPATSLATGPLLARVLGPEGRGTLAAATAPLFLLSVVAVMAVPEGATYAIGRLRRPPAVVTRAAVTLCAVYGLLGAVLLVAAAPVLLDGNPAAVPLLRRWAWTLPLLTTGLALRHVTLGRRRYGLVNAERVLAAGGRLIGLVGLAVVGALTAATALATQVVTTVGGTALLAAATLAATRRRPDGSGRVAGGVDVTGETCAPDVTDGALAGVRGTHRLLARYGLLGWGGVGANLLSWRIDQIVLAAFVGPASLAFYAVAVNLSELPAVVLGAARNVALSESAHGGDDTRLPELARTIVWLTVLVCGVGAVAAGPVVALLFGGDFAGAVPFARILLVATIPLVAEQVLATGLLASGRPGRRSIGQLAAAVVTVVGLALTVSRHGAMGAAWTSMAAYTTAAAVTGHQLARTHGVALRHYLSPPRPSTVLAFLRATTNGRG